jgi:glycosyltransferase involved in cell wall biosynthesis
VNDFLMSVTVIIPAKDPGKVLDECLASIFKQSAPYGWSLSVVVIDDGSDIPITLCPELSNNKHVFVSRSKVNEGRSQAINRGLNLASSKYVWLIDADCILEKCSHFERVVSNFKQGIDFCFGRTISSGDDFWSRYHNGVASDRVNSKEFTSYTTACFAANRLKLLEVGGFNSEYQHYGFEDKDLVATLVESFGEKNCCLDTALTAIHEDRPTIKGVAIKFNQSGMFSAPIFFRRHASIYKKLAYSRYDPRIISPVRSFVLRILAPFIRWLLPLAAYCIGSSLIPYKMKKLFVQSICAVAYFTGGCGKEWPKY